jgi:RNA polymerase sigma factor (sigma-70 family)
MMVVTEEVVPAERTASGRRNDDEHLYWVLKKAVAHQAPSEGENDHALFIGDLLALYRARGTHEILEQAWAYALTHLLWGGEKDERERNIQESKAFILSQTMLKRLIEEKGPTGALDDLFARYDRFFHKIAYCVLYNYELAHDGVSIAWERVYRWLVVCSNDGPECEDPLSYLCMIVINACRSVRRKEYQQSMRIQLAGRDLEERERRTFETPEDALVRLEREQMVREAVEQLSPKHRQAIRFRYFLDDEVLHGSVEINDERYEQISTVTGRKETTLRSDVRRALKHLRKLLAERGIQR